MAISANGPVASVTHTTIVQNVVPEVPYPALHNMFLGCYSVNVSYNCTCTRITIQTSCVQSSGCTWG